MKQINILDCTLRDGGYINDWNFGARVIHEVTRKIIRSGIEYFEVGFVRNIVYDKNYSLYNGNDSVVHTITPKNLNTKYLGMIDMEQPVSLERLSNRIEEGFDGFRVIFKKDKIDNAILYIQELLKYGYQVFAQPVNTNIYKDCEWIEIINRFNKLAIQAFYIVDSFGTIKKKDLLRMIYIADHNLRSDIMLGYHSHNNMQQAMMNAVALVEQNLNRDIVIDASVFGMGRGAGNLNLELFLEYMNENYEKRYYIEPLLEIIDEYLNDIYRYRFWGYSMPFYLSARNLCHPNYSTYFASKGSLTVKSCNEILQSISIEDREVFSKDKAEKYYLEYQKNFFDDKKTTESIKKKLSNKKILLLGSGESIQKQKEKIKTFIEEEKPVIIGMNFIPKDYKCDFAFFNHMRKFRKYKDSKTKKIISSNLREIKEEYIINFSSYVPKSLYIIDNSGIMFINLLIYLDIKVVYLAGFDGYDVAIKGNYVKSGLEYDFSSEMLEIRNQKIKEEIQRQKKYIKVFFLTSSLYE